MPTNGQAQAPAPPDSEAPSSDENDDQENNDQTLQAPQIQPGEELGEEQEEGGGEEGPSVNPNRPDYDIEDDGNGVIQKITFRRRDRPPVVMVRPDKDTNDHLLWRLLDAQRKGARRKRELVTAINKARDVLMSVSGGSVRATKVARINAMVSDVSAPEPLEWWTKALPRELKNAIEADFFLQIEESVTDKHGNVYVPARRPSANGRMQWRGSMLGGKFPHAVVSVKKPGDGVTDRTEEFMCATCNNIELTVRLKTFVDGLPKDCSESVLLDKVNSAHNPNQRSLWGLLESRMYLYCYLEFEGDSGSGTPVGAYAFSKTPDSSGVFKPTECPPSYLNDGKPGFYEFRMERGEASIEFKFQESVTTSNLNKDYKPRLFRLVVKAINPFLAGLEGMTARSSPFMIKSVLHNDVKSNERYVRGPDNSIVDSGPADLPTA
tara:strand:- start:666 stop:1973 length:1308 start_codon:yes stop_codon:yes gene_type:complete